jgi:pyridoxamine 5'-phosphate oxidase
VDPSTLHADPGVQFARWFDEATAEGVEQPDAAALATATVNGRPSVRMVLVKGHDGRGLVFFTNLESRKGRELSSNPRAALAVYWQPLGRQVRVGEREARAYFDTRPRGSRLAAWASPQSQPLQSREELERLFAEAVTRFEGIEHPPLPPHWGGFRLRPDAFEFWESRPNRLHERVRYMRDGDVWVRTRLAP